MNESTFANVARALAEQFPPRWNIPLELQPFALPDRDLAEYCQMRNEQTLHACRTVISERLEAIENGWFYEHRGIGSNPLRAALDKAEAYHRLWWIDVFITVHERP